MLTDLHQRVWKEYGHVIGYGFDRERARTNNRGGLHRLQHLAPSIVATQEQLAKVLAEIALNSVMERMQTSQEALVVELLELAKAEEKAGKDGYRRLMALAKTKEWEARAAYDAILLLTDERYRTYIHRDESGVAYKSVKQFPDVLLPAMKMTRPARPKGGHDKADGPFFDGGIVLMVHVASESSLCPTHNDERSQGREQGKACVEIVAEVLQEHYPRLHPSVTTVRNKWIKRSKCYPSLPVKYL